MSFCFVRWSASHTRSTCMYILVLYIYIFICLLYLVYFLIYIYIYRGLHIILNNPKYLCKICDMFLGISENARPKRKRNPSQTWSWALQIKPTCGQQRCDRKFPQTLRVAPLNLSFLCFGVNFLQNCQTVFFWGGGDMFFYSWSCPSFFILFIFYEGIISDDPYESWLSN